MDTVRQAWKLQSLIDSKHQFARSIDSCTRQLIQLAIGQSSDTSLKPKEPYSPTKAVFQADLVSFAKTIFSTSLINALTDLVKKQTRQLATKMDQYHDKEIAGLDHLQRIILGHTDGE
jgi:hypothetical protein